MASLSNFGDQVPGDIATPENHQAARSTYITLMYNKHYTLSTIHYHAPTGTWLVQGSDSLLPADYTPPPDSPGPDTYTREDEPDDLHIWGTWGHKSLQTLLFSRSANLGVGRTMYCLAKWTGQSRQIPAQQWVRQVTLRPQQREAPLNCTGRTPQHPITMQLCPFMVAARLMTLLWPGPDTPTQHNPHLTEEHMPGIQRCFFGTVHCLQHSAPHVLALTLTPAPGSSPIRALGTTPRHHHTHNPEHRHLLAHRTPGKARAQARCSNPHPHPPCPRDPATSTRARRLGTPAVRHIRPLHHRLHPGPLPSPTSVLSASNSTISNTTTTSSTSTTTTSSSKPAP